MSLDASELEILLERLLDPVLSSRRTVGDAARALARRNGGEQQFVLNWVRIICATNAELAYRFACKVEQALGAMDRDSTEDWIVEALDHYDRDGLYAGYQVLNDIERFIQERGRRSRAARLQNDREMLERYLQGLSGRSMHIRAGEAPSTDTEFVVLPEVVEQMAEREDNRLLLKAMATQLWAMNRFGTFRRISPDAPTLKQRLDKFKHPQQAVEVFQALETERLNACISRELPGLGRQLEQRFGNQHLDATWQVAVNALAEPGASVNDTLEWTRKITARQIHSPPRSPWQGRIDFSSADEILEQRLSEDQEALQKLIQDLIDNMNQDDLALAADGEAEIELNAEAEGDGADAMELKINGQSIDMPGALKDKIDSILQDLEQVPEEWLSALDQPTESEAEAAELADADETDPVFYYDEWDHQRRHYRKNWCTLYERQVSEGPVEFISDTLHKHQGCVLDLKRAFEVLRDQQHTLRRQPEGEDIDLDAVVEATSDQMRGEELSDRLFLKTHRQERDIAVMFMVDLSGSTKGWIVDAEREALVLLCEALEVLGDRYGIYGFSGMTRKRCELLRIKEVGEPYNDVVKGRISGIRPRDYTRMGVTIRHLTHLMERIDARTRLLITLSDGKPDDYDGYRGEYGIEDTRQALIEARNRGIHPFCITIDRQGSDYLPHMYGAVNYTVVDDVRKLPREVSEVYCRLTR